VLHGNGRHVLLADLDPWHSGSVTVDEFIAKLDQFRKRANILGLEARLPTTTPLLPPQSHRFHRFLASLAPYSLCWMSSIIDPLFPLPSLPLRTLCGLRWSRCSIGMTRRTRQEAETQRKQTTPAQRRTLRARQWGEEVHGGQ